MYGIKQLSNLCINHNYLQFIFLLEHYDDFVDIYPTKKKKKKKKKERHTEGFFYFLVLDHIFSFFVYAVV